MKLCVVIPALNEDATITEVVKRVPLTIPKISEVVIVVVDDGSSDDTRKLALQTGAVVVSHIKNLGVGAALQTGIEKALELDADFMVNMDADGQFSPEDILTLVQPLINDEAEFVTASRFINRDFYPSMHPLKFYGNKLMSVLISLLTGRKFYDVSCGFRGYTRNVLLQLNLHGLFTYTQESFLELSFKGISIAEVPLMVRGNRRHGQSRIASNLFKYSFRTSKIIFRSFRDYRPMVVFGLFAATAFVAAIVLGSFLLYHYSTVGGLSPHKWAGFTAAFLAGIGVLVLVTGMVADMLTRIRVNQERILFLLKKQNR